MSNVLYVGLGVHTKTSTCHVFNKNGKKMTQWCRTIRGHWQERLNFLESLKKPMVVAYEASLSYGVIYDRLETFAQRVVVAPPGELRLIFKSKRKNDRVDAEKIAKLLLLDELAEVYVPCQAMRVWREMIELRRSQIEKRTKTKNGLQAMLRKYAITKPKEFKGLWTKRGQAWLQTVQWDNKRVTYHWSVLIRELKYYDREIAKLTKQLDQLAKPQAAMALLMTIPGVGPRTAEALLAYIVDPFRFLRANQIGAYFGLVPSQNASADRNHYGHITKQGPSTVRKYITESAWHAIRQCKRLRTFFDRVCGDKKDRRKIALIAVARKLVTIALAMLKSGEVYRMDPLTPKETTRISDTIVAELEIDCVDVTTKKMDEVLAIADEPKKAKKQKRVKKNKKQAKTKKTKSQKVKPAITHMQDTIIGTGVGVNAVTPVAIRGSGPVTTWPTSLNRGTGVERSPDSRQNNEGAVETPKRLIE